MPQRPTPTSDGVTVVMITHNRCAEALRTLQHMTGLPDGAPIVVVDNGSTDGTAGAITTRFPEVKLIASSSNLGAIGRNRAVADVTTPFVAFCDDDIRWPPGA